MNKLRGFTLVEVMIAASVTSILAAIALPSYNDVMRRSHLSGALANLYGYQARLEKAYQSAGNYGVTDCVVSAPPASPQFTYSCALTDSGKGFTAAAIGVGSMAGYAYTANAGGLNATTAYPNAKDLPKACWWVRPGDC